LAAEGAARQYRPGSPHGAKLAVAVLIAPDIVEIGDIEITATDDHAVGVTKVLGEHPGGIGPAIAVLIAQHGDAARLGLGDEHIAIRGDGHPARVIEAIGEVIDQNPSGTLSVLRRERRIRRDGLVALSEA
jgi:hypothetical protein